MVDIHYKVPERESYVKVTLKNQLIHPPSENYYDTEPDNWKLGLKQYLRDSILPLSFNQFPEELHDQILSVLLNDENEHVWVKCFTHITYDPEDNYELLENLGDIAVQLGFGEFMREKIVNLTEGLASQYNNFFLAKKFLSSIGSALLVDKWVRSIIKVNISIKEDIVEAIFGAIMELGETKLAKGNGYKLCYGLVLSLYQNVDFEMAKLKTDKTLYKEIIDRLHWGNISKNVEEKNQLANGNFQVFVKIPPEGRQWLAFYKINLPEVIGTATASLVDIAWDKAYKQAMDTLAAKNITPQNVENFAIAQERHENGPYGPFFQMALLKATNQGYLGIDFVKFPKKRKSDELLFSELYGEKKVGEKIVKEVFVIASIKAQDMGKFSIREKELKKFTLQCYIGYGKITQLVDYETAKQMVEQKMVTKVAEYEAWKSASEDQKAEKLRQFLA